MSSQPTMIQSSAMPAQEVTPMPPGSKGPMDAGIKLQQQQTTNQMALIGSQTSGGSKKKKTRGGATPVVQVPPVSSGAVNPQATSSNYSALTDLAVQQQTNATYDNAKTSADTAALQAQQQSLYSGGSKKGSSWPKRGGSSWPKRGGSWPKWGCFSGGKKSRKSRKIRKSRKVKKNRKSKRRHQ